MRKASTSVGRRARLQATPGRHHGRMITPAERRTNLGHPVAGQRTAPPHGDVACRRRAMRWLTRGGYWRTDPSEEENGVQRA